MNLNINLGQLTELCPEDNQAKTLRRVSREAESRYYQTIDHSWRHAETFYEAQKRYTASTNTFEQSRQAWLDYSTYCKNHGIKEKR